MQRIVTSVARTADAALATNKVLRNTFTLLSMTLLFSAAVAGLSMAFNWPHPGLLITLVGYFGLLFLTHKLANSVWGLAAVFALTGFMGLTLGALPSDTRYADVSASDSSQPGYRSRMVSMRIRFASANALCSSVMPLPSPR